MASKGNAPKLRNGLTQKQNAFKNEIVKQIENGEQINGTKAALKVYDTTDKNSAHVIAIDNLQNLTIQKIIQKELEAEGWNSSESLKNIRKLSQLTPEKVTITGVLNANIKLLELTGNIPGSKHTDSGSKQINIINLNFDQAKAKVQELNSLSNDFIQDAEAV